MSWPRVIRPPVISSSSATWSPTNKNANVTLSNGNLTATGSGFPGVACATASFSGKTYWEITAVSTSDTNGIGFCNATLKAGIPGGAWPGGDNNGVAYFQDGNVSVNGSASANYGAFVGGDIISVAVDPVGELAWWRTNGGVWNGSGTADPATGIGGFDITFMGGAPLWAAFTLGASQQTANFGATAFSYAIPSGFIKYGA